MAMTMDRRAALRVATRAAVCATAAAPALAFAAADAQALPSFFAELEERTFRFFWDCADPDTGLMPDRWPTPSFCSIAAVGFALTAWPLGAERGWVSRGEVRERTLRTLRFVFEFAPFFRANLHYLRENSHSMIHRIQLYDLLNHHLIIKLKDNKIHGRFGFP